MMRRKLFYRRNSLDRFYPLERRQRTGARGILLGILAAVYFLLAPWPFQDFRSGGDLAILNENSQADNPSGSSTPLIAEEAQSEPAPKTVDLTLGRGDTLLAMLMKHGLQGAPANDLINKLKPFYNPRRMRPGDSFRLLYNEDGTAIQSLEHATSGALVRILSTEEGWVAERVEIPYVRATKVVRGSISASLFEDGVGAGLSPGHIHKLADLFEHDIDFFSDIHRGDDFSVVLEEKRYANGESEKGRVLAAKIQAGGSPYQIFYFKGNNDKGSYYDTHGRTLMKAFLRAPLSYSRISSSFNLNRRHPIFRTVRPHQAIDYAAPTGTPVVSVGHGRVTFAGTRGGYGKMVEVQHNNGYVSRYAHFSRIAKGLRAGKSVSQGELVGYVGQTGHATGPHLHFEMLNKGRKINFLNLKTAAQEKLTGAELQAFLAFRDKKLPLLKGIVPGGSEQSNDSVANAQSSNTRSDALAMPSS